MKTYKVQHDTETGESRLRGKTSYIKANTTRGALKQALVIWGVDYFQQEDGTLTDETGAVIAPARKNDFIYAGGKITVKPTAARRVSWEAVTFE
jgi:hypothetical protein